MGDARQRLHSHCCWFKVAYAACSLGRLCCHGLRDHHVREIQRTSVASGVAIQSHCQRASGEVRLMEGCNCCLSCLRGLKAHGPVSLHRRTTDPPLLTCSCHGLRRAATTQHSVASVVTLFQCTPPWTQCSMSLCWHETTGAKEQMLRRASRATCRLRSLPTAVLYWPAETAPHPTASVAAKDDFRAGRVVFAEQPAELLARVRPRQPLHHDLSQMQQPQVSCSSCHCSHNIKRICAVSTRPRKHSRGTEQGSSRPCVSSSVMQTYLQTAALVSGLFARRSRGALSALAGLARRPSLPLGCACARAKARPRTLLRRERLAPRRPLAARRPWRAHWLLDAVLPVNPPASSCSRRSTDV